MDAENPYQSPDTMAAADARASAVRLPWATTTPARCFLGAMLLWPAVAIITDLLGIFPGRWFGIDDFGLAASNVTMPTCWLLAVVLWIRAFMLATNRPRTVSVVLALLSLPLWFIATASMTFLMFPFGRISDTF